MRACVALLRGINVGGRNILPMKEFRALLDSLGCENIATYIQSGNAVFTCTSDGKQLATTIASAIDSKFGFRPSVLVLAASDYLAIVAANPYLKVEADGKLNHIWFLGERASNADLPRLQKLRAKDERFKLTDRAFYLHAPAGIGRSALAANVEKHLGVTATSRNRRTVEKIATLLEKIGQPL